GPPWTYGKGRVFVQLSLRGSKDGAMSRKLAALRRAGHPCIVVPLDDTYDLGAEFNRWEIATAVAGSVLGIDPFDEPNVKESKDNTAHVLEQYQATGVLPSAPPDLADAGIRAWTTLRVPPSIARVGARARKGPDGVRRLVDALCRAVRPGDYVALMAYLKMDDATRGRLERLRLRIRARCRVATTLGFG